MSETYDKSLYNQLDEALWVTKGTRFLTYKKYKSILNITSFSFLLIVISIYKIGGYIIFEGKYDKDIDVILLILAIYIFSTSIYLSTLELKVTTIFNNATNISYLLRQLKLVKNDNDLNNISTEYNKYEQELNHDSIDYKKWCNESNSDKHKNSCIGEIFYFITWHIYGKFPIVIFSLIVYLVYYYLIKLQ